MKSRGKVKVAVILAVALIGGLGLIAYNCGPQPIDLKIKQDNSAPSGSVPGKVRDAITGAVLANVEVKTIIGTGKASTRTDSSGNYNLGGLPGSSDLRLIFSLTGYVTGTIPVTTPGTVGGFWPSGNGILTVADQYLYPANGSIAVTVTSTTTCTGRCWTGSPITNATVVIDLTPNYEVTVNQKTDSAGKTTFTGLPGAADGFNICPTSLPIDCNGDGKPDLDADSACEDLFPNATSNVTISYTAGDCL